MKRTMKNFYILSLFIFFSCSHSEEKIAQYQSQIEALTTQNSSLQSKLVNQETQLNALHHLVKLQQENDSLSKVIKDLDTKVINQQVNGEMIGFDANLIYHLPKEILTLMESLSNEYKVIADINPFFLKVNFSGSEGDYDHMIRIEHIATKKKGFIIVDETYTENFLILGAGERMNGSSDDFSFISTFFVEKLDNMKNSIEVWKSDPRQEVVILYSSDHIPVLFYRDVSEFQLKWIGD
ncbi:hypothetical protein [Flammeovirga sp. OC4]|uniref:hypothetical protein n=1 Tax=Flammeovirga sp. OC4 TaxID=1382345 RepID=UPI0005C51643|nr:hypothetical protein [Flammeovirga sp. OC4]